ncbi:MAG: Lrp/AsnC family transcriptional regulator [Chloroflexota bacterium]|nr:AsnC family transcriptional regulator [Candidatus Sulfotelmatobacter sp.]
MATSIDALDVKIMKSLSEDCRKSTTQIAKESGTSRPTAIARINQLSENQIIDFGAKINLKKLGFKFATIHFETSITEGASQIVEELRRCPRVVQLIQLVEKPNYTALIYVEDAETLLSSIGCLESYLNLKITSYQRVIPLIGESFNLHISLEKCAKTPCGKECGLCLSYQHTECVGCPTSKEYRGTI